MVLHCAICDDEPEMVELVKKKAEKVFAEKDVTSKILTYTNSKQFLFELEDNSQLDLLILDIQMPSVTGLEIAAIVKKKHKNCLIVFLTSYLNYAVDGYELEIFRFVPKSEIDLRLERTISDAAKVIDFESKKSYYIKKHDLCIKVPYKDILYITKSGKNSVICCRGASTVNVRKTLAEVFNELNSEEFVYIDRSCIANMSNVRKIDKHDWVCENGDRIPISHSSYTRVKQNLMDFWGRIILDD